VPRVLGQLKQVQAGGRLRFAVPRAFGADLDEAVLREPGAPVPVPEEMTDAAPVIRVGEAGDWVIVIEEDELPWRLSRPTSRAGTG
jgi:hypothetical protein